MITPTRSFAAKPLSVNTRKMFLYLVIILIVLCLIDLGINYNEKARTLKKVPGPKDTFIFGNTFEILLSPGKLIKIL